MVKYCTAANCKNDSYTRGGVSLHLFPDAIRDYSRRIKWEKFVRQKRKNFQHATPFTYLCSDHFVREDFENITGVEMGFEKNKRLKPQSIPSIQKDMPTSKEKVVKESQCSLCRCTKSSYSYSPNNNNRPTTTTDSETLSSPSTSGDRRKKSILMRDLRKELLLLSKRKVIKMSKETPEMLTRNRKIPNFTEELRFAIKKEMDEESCEQLHREIDSCMCKQSPEITTMKLENEIKEEIQEIDEIISGNQVEFQTT